ncbi:sugar-transfer associated ATP-grasp domain-containing protein [Albibacterium bauzanense]|nr:sugar-transfer associated ATP-grasp domain-containing protein [Albibacterium bauzanense]
MNVFNTISMMSKGFDVESIYLYSLNKTNYKKYLPDSAIPKISLNSNNGYWPILHDKFVFYRFIKDKLPTGELLGIVFKGEITAVDGVFGYAELLEGLKKSNKYVLKPLQGGNTTGILFLSLTNEALILQGKPIDQDILKSTINGLNEYGIFKFYEQHKLFAKIYPGSINTIRLVTLYDFEQKKPFIHASILRMGWSRSAPFHNFQKRGLVSLIDNETGLLSICKRKDENGRITHQSNHPDTNQVIEGMVIPFWEDIKGTILAYLEKNPFLDYVGWDILVTDEGFLVIEANHNPGLGFMQAFKPLLEDPRGANYFKTKNIYAS